MEAERVRQRPQPSWTVGPKRKVNVEMLGGMLEVEWKSDGEMYLTGSCHFICEGDYPCILQETGA